MEVFKKSMTHFDFLPVICLWPHYTLHALFGSKHLLVKSAAGETLSQVKFTLRQFVDGENKTSTG